MENTIAIASLQIGYQQKTVVKNINLTVRPGEILGMLGPSGSGKTTLIRAIMGMIKPMSGTVRVFGQAMPNRHLLEKIGYMGQTDALYDALTARENLQFFASLRKELQLRLSESYGWSGYSRFWIDAWLTFLAV